MQISIYNFAQENENVSNKLFIQKTAKPPDFSGGLIYFGATDGIRTCDLLITNQLLYQLSYGSTIKFYYSAFIPMAAISAALAAAISALVRRFLAFFALLMPDFLITFASSAMICSSSAVQSFSSSDSSSQ